MAAASGGLGRLPPMQRTPSVGHTPSADEDDELPSASSSLSSSRSPSLASRSIRVIRADATPPASQSGRSSPASGSSVSVAASGRSPSTRHDVSGISVGLTHKDPQDGIFGWLAHKFKVIFSLSNTFAEIPKPPAERPDPARATLYYRRSVDALADVSVVRTWLDHEDYAPVRVWVYEAYSKNTFDATLYTDPCAFFLKSTAYWPLADKNLHRRIVRFVDEIFTQLKYRSADDLFSWEHHTVSVTVVGEDAITGKRTADSLVVNCNRYGYQLADLADALRTMNGRRRNLKFFDVVAIAAPIDLVFE